MKGVGLGRRIGREMNGMSRSSDLTTDTDRKAGREREAKSVKRAYEMKMRHGRKEYSRKRRGPLRMRGLASVVLWHDARRIRGD